MRVGVFFLGVPLGNTSCVEVVCLYKKPVMLADANESRVTVAMGVARGISLV